jgi:ABC-type transport system involved in multi-copper enzyme maturation permease subunit
MSSAVDVMTTPEKRPLSWGLWLRQIRAILSLELHKNFLSRRSLLIYLIAALPLFPLMVLALVRPPGSEFRDFSNYGKVYAVLYHGFIMRTVVFFGCAWIFMNLFRGELVDRSLHYYFLSAVRREVLVVGKYLSGLLTSMVMFTATTVIAMLLLYVPFYSQNVRYFSDGQGLGHMLGYAGITMLACVGYGAFFLVVGLFIRNPIIPALLLYGWEWLNFLLPPLLKKISVVHYLNSLMPVPLSTAIVEGPLAVVAEPTPAWIAIPSMLLVTLLVLVLAAYRTRHMEIRYGSE